MITHTRDWHQIPRQKRQSRSYKLKKIAKNSNFEIVPKALHVTYLRLLDEMYKYEMDPIRTVGITERTRYARQTDGQTDGWSETDISPHNNFVVRRV